MDDRVIQNDCHSVGAGLCSAHNTLNIILLSSGWSRSPPLWACLIC